MKAIFIGKDGSLGFKYGETYLIRGRLDVRRRVFSPDTPLIIVTGRLLDGDREITCPYSSLQALLANWKILP